MATIGQFEHRGTIVQMMLFAYAVGVGTFTSIHIPILGIGAVSLLILAYAFSAYGFWKLAQPDLKRRLPYYLLLLAALAAVSGILYSFVSEISSFVTLQMQNSVTATIEKQHNTALLLLLLIHTAASAVLALAYFLLYRPQRLSILRIFALSWATLPVLFLLMTLYEMVLPTVSEANMMILFFGWIAATGVIGYGTYLLTDGDRIYVALFVILTLAAPPVSAAAFVIFMFLKTLMPAVKKTAGGSDANQALKNNPQYERQLKAAKSALKIQKDAMASIESAIKRTDPNAMNARKKIQELEKQKAVVAMKIIAAEEAYERLQKTQR